MSKFPALYKKFFIDKQDERLELFRILQKEYNLEHGIYPGSFVHITPSLVIPEMVYIDMDKRCPTFFRAEETKKFIAKNKEYTKEASYKFYHQDYTEKINLKLNSYDFVISFYAGFISKYYTKYLKPGGILLVNNSHGDAPLAYLSSDLELIGIVKRNGNKFTLSKKDLKEYFQLKSGEEINKEEIEKTMRGPSYTKTAYVYVFKRNKGKAPALYI